MMAGPFLDHHRDPAAELLVNRLDHRRDAPQQGIDAAADVQDRYVGRRKVAELLEDVGVDSGVVGVDARDLARIRGRPGVGVLASATHPDECRLPGESVLLREEGVPGVPRLARFQGRVGRDISDVEAAPEQFHLGLRLMVPVAAAPRPGVTRGGLPGDDDDAPAFSPRRVLDPESLIFLALERLDVERPFVHQVVVAVESVVPGTPCAFEGRIVDGRRSRGDRTPHRQDDRQTQQDLADGMLVHVLGLSSICDRG